MNPRIPPCSICRAAGIRQWVFGSVCENPEHEKILEVAYWKSHKVVNGLVEYKKQ